MTEFNKNIFNSLNLLSITKKYFYIILFLSSLVLIAAYGLEIIGNLPPCKLCLYQRIPYIVLIVLSVIYLKLFKNIIIIYLSLLSLISNLTISIFHSLIERKLISFELGCTSTNQEFKNIEDLRNYLDKIPIAKCDEIPFEFLHLSIANLNLIISFLLIIFTIYTLLNYEK